MEDIDDEVQSALDSSNGHLQSTHNSTHGHRQSAHNDSKQSAHSSGNGHVAVVAGRKLQYKSGLSTSCEAFKKKNQVESIRLRKLQRDASVQKMRVHVSAGSDQSIPSGWQDATIAEMAQRLTDDLKAHGTGNGNRSLASLARELQTRVSPSSDRKQTESPVSDILRCKIVPTLIPLVRDPDVRYAIRELCMWVLVNVAHDGGNEEEREFLCAEQLIDLACSIAADRKETVGMRLDAALLILNVAYEHEREMRYAHKQGATEALLTMLEDEKIGRVDLQVFSAPKTRSPVDALTYSLSALRCIYGPKDLVPESKDTIKRLVGCLATKMQTFIESERRVRCRQPREHANVAADNAGNCPRCSPVPWYLDTLRKKMMCDMTFMMRRTVHCNDPSSNLSDRAKFAVVCANENKVVPILVHLIDRIVGDREQFVSLHALHALVSMTCDEVDCTDVVLTTLNQSVYNRIAKVLHQAANKATIACYGLVANLVHDRPDVMAKMLDMGIVESVVQMMVIGEIDWQVEAMLAVDVMLCSKAAMAMGRADDSCGDDKNSSSSSSSSSSAQQSCVLPIDVMVRKYNLCDGLVQMLNLSDPVQKLTVIKIIEAVLSRGNELRSNGNKSKNPYIEYIEKSVYGDGLQLMSYIVNDRNEHQKVTERMNQLFETYLDREEQKEELDLLDDGKGPQKPLFDFNEVGLDDFGPFDFGNSQQQWHNSGNSGSSSSSSFSSSSSPSSSSSYQLPTTTTTTTSASKTVANDVADDDAKMSSSSVASTVREFKGLDERNFTERKEHKFPTPSLGSLQSAFGPSASSWLAARSLSTTWLPTSQLTNQTANQLTNQLVSATEYEDDEL